MTAPLQLPMSLPSNLYVPIVDLRSELPVNPNYTWESRRGNRNINDLNTIVFHHDAWPKTISARFTDVQLAREIAGDHIRSTKNLPGGDPGFPYDAWIRNGTIYIGNDMLPLKFGVANNNDHTIHICCSGDYVNGDVLTDQDRNAMYAAFFLYKSAMPAYEQLKGHKELNPSSCPGYSMEVVRKELESLTKEAEFNETPAKRAEIAYRIANELMYLYNMGQGKKADGTVANEGEKSWAINRLLLLEPEMRKQGFLK